jgi:lipopolysaccharide O-acetyltransferase
MTNLKRMMMIPKRALEHIRRKRFYKKYNHINRASYIGTDGIGKGCVLEGDSRIHVGKDTFIGKGSELLAYSSHFDRQLDSQIIIGEHVRITARCRITCAGLISIGKDSLFGPEVFITDHNHGMDPETMGGYSPQEIMVERVIIEEGVWLGQRVCVLPGVTIGAHSIIGVNSVVTSNIPPYSIAVGVPAKVIKRWNKELKIWEKV